MFTLKFATNKTLKASSISEDYFSPSEEVLAAYKLNIGTEEDYEIEFVIGVLNESGALDSITVTSDDEGTSETIVTGYTKIDSVSKRLLSNGKWIISIVLSK